MNEFTITGKRACFGRKCVAINNRDVAASLCKRRVRVMATRKKCEVSNIRETIRLVSRRAVGKPIPNICRCRQGNNKKEGEARNAEHPKHSLFRLIRAVLTGRRRIRVATEL